MMMYVLHTVTRFNLILDVIHTASLFEIQSTIKGDEKEKVVMPP